MIQKITKRVHQKWLERRKEKDEGVKKTENKKSKKNKDIPLKEKLDQLDKDYPDEDVPEKFLGNMEYRVLFALNGSEKTIIDIFRNSKTKIAYSDVHLTVRKLIDKGYIKMLGRRKHKLGIFVKISSKGVEQLFNWQDKHITGV